MAVSISLWVGVDPHLVGFPWVKGGSIRDAYTFLWPFSAPGVPSRAIPIPVVNLSDALIRIGGFCKAMQSMCGGGMANKRTPFVDAVVVASNCVISLLGLYRVVWHLFVVSWRPSAKAQWGESRRFGYWWPET